MIDVKDVLSLEFYKKSPFHGSYKGIRYRIEKIEEGETTNLKCTTWPEPYSFDATDDSLKECFTASFSDEGLESIVSNINKKVFDK